MAAGKYKAEAVGGGPLSEEARAHVQGLIDGSYDRFVGDVANGRGVNAEDIRSGYGEGRVLNAEQALGARMVDRIGTLSDTLSRIASGAPAPAARALAEPAITGEEPKESRFATSALVAFEQQLLTLERNAVR